MFGQYIFNNTVVNPAHAGSNADNEFGVIARSQWMGIDGAPRSETVYANMKLGRSLGLSLGIYQDRLGPETNLHFKTDLAYHARLTADWRLAGGIRVFMSNHKINFTDIPNIDPTDPLFSEDVRSGLLMNLGAGLLAYNQKYFVGLSVPRVFSSHVEVLDSQIGSTSPQVDLREITNMHIFAYAGANFELYDDLVFMPSVMYRHVTDAPIQSDINTFFGFKDVLEFGPFLRTNIVDKHSRLDAVGFVVGLRFLRNWHFGYLYEYPLSDLNLKTRQTHEISLKLMLPSRHDQRPVSPRYFI